MKIKSVRHYSWLLSAALVVGCGAAAVADASLPGIASGAVGHTLAVNRFGTVYAWGGNFAGQLGRGDNLPSDTPIVVPSLTGIVQVATGGDSSTKGYSLAVRSDGVVFSWGYNGDGQLGLGNTAPGPTSPSQLPTLSDVLQVAAGKASVVAVKRDGTVWAWGLNDQGQLGRGNNFPSSSPLQVPNLTNVVKVSVGVDHVLALKNDGTVWAWGNNASGQIGNGGTLNALSPALVTGLPPIVDVAANFAESYALGADGGVYSWGRNVNGELGDMSTNNSRVPVEVKGFLPEIVSLGNGGAYGQTGSIVAADGRLWKWGWGSHGQMGDGLTTTANPVPNMLAGTPNQQFRFASMGLQNFGIKNDGTVRAWGRNLSGPGELGTVVGPVENGLIPATVLGVGGVGALNLGHYTGRKSNFSGLNTDGWLFWRNPAAGLNNLWRLINNVVSPGVPLPSVGPTWTVVGTGDLNGNGKSDIVWADAGGALQIWEMDGPNIVNSVPLGSLPAGWKAIGVADVNGDGKDDILFRFTASGLVAVWIMDGTTVRSVVVPGAVPTNFILAGIGDFDGSNSQDLLWMNPATGTLLMWQMYENGLKKEGVVDVIGPGWTATVGDFNGDGRSDILWRKGATNILWYMAGREILRSDVLSPTSAEVGWNPVAVMDAGNTGRDDIIWMHTSGVVYRWIMQGVGRDPLSFPLTYQGQPVVLPAGWRVVGQ